MGEEMMEQPSETGTFTDTENKSSFLASLLKEEGIIVVGLVVLIALILIFSLKSSRGAEESRQKTEQKPAIIREIIREVAKPPEPAQPTNEGGK